MSDFNVMLIEDAGIVANDIGETVKSAGFQLEWKFSSAEEALEVLETSVPELILMDIELSGEIDGIEATERIHETFDVPIVFLTAYSNPETIERATNTDAVAYLVKPLEKSDLVSLIEWIRSDRTTSLPDIERGELLSKE